MLLSAHAKRLSVTRLRDNNLKKNNIKKFLKRFPPCLPDTFPQVRDCPRVHRNLPAKSQGRGETVDQRDHQGGAHQVVHGSPSGPPPTRPCRYKKEMEIIIATQIDIDKKLDKQVS